MSGEPINEDSEDIRIFDDFNATVDFLVNPKVNATLMALPFLRNVPGIYKNGFQAVLNARERLLRKYFHKIKVNTTVTSLFIK